MEESEEKKGWIFWNKSIFPRMILWLGSSIIFDFLGLYSTSGSGWDSSTITRHSLGEISSIAMLGILFFLGAGLFLSSRFVRNSDRPEKQYLLKPFIGFLFLTTLYLVIRPFIIFNTFVQFGEPGASVNAAFLYGALLAAPIISFLFCSLAAGLAILVDDWRITTIVGCSLFIVTNLFLGMPHAPALYPEVSLFSPSQFYRGIILTFSGLYVTMPLFIQNWGGLTSFTYMIVPTIVYIILTLISIWAIIQYGPENQRRRQLLRKSDTIQVTEQEQMDETRLKNRLKARRKSVLVCFVVFGLLIPIGGFSYTSSREYDVRTVIYQRELQPTNGELFCESFITEALPPELSQWIGFPLDILDWGQCPSPITFEYVFRAGSINEFFNMTESDRWRLSRTISLEDDQTMYLHNSYSGLDELGGPHYWVFRFYSNDWTEEQGELRIRISVILLEMSDI